MAYNQRKIYSLPDGYIQLEYITSSGAQYIDTEYVPNKNTCIDIVTMPLEDADVTSEDGVGFTPYGAAISYCKSSFECYSGTISSTIGRQFQVNYGNVYRDDTNFIGSFSVNQIVSISQDKNKVAITVGESQYTSTLTANDFEAPPYTMLLFASNRPNSSNTGSDPMISGDMRLYSCLIYDDGILKRNYVPCKNASGEVGLYDLVGGKFYGNANTVGTFSDGPKVTSPDPTIPYAILGFFTGNRVAAMRDM